MENVHFRRLLAAVFFTATVMLLADGPTVAYASDTYTVTTSTDELDGTCGSDNLATFEGAGDGLSLREAICLANQDTDTDFIEFDSSLTDISLTIVGALEQSNVTGDFDVTEPLIINGSDQRIIEVAGDRIFDFHPGSEISEINNMELRQGSSDARGGAILHRNGGLLTLVHVEVNDNTADSDGGGIALRSSSTLRLLHAIISGNTSGGAGGGIWVETGSTVIAEKATFLSNTAGTLSTGGGLFNTSDDTVLTNVIFNGNTAYDGGALSDLSSSATLTNVTFVGNTASNGGGAIYTNNSTITIQNSIFWANTASNDGDAILNFTGDLTITHTLLDESKVTNNFGGTWTDSDTTNITDGSDPLFVDADGADDTAGNADDDLRLQGNSPAIDSGNNDLVPAGVSSDIADIPRILDGDGNETATVDMGAHEYVAGIIYVDMDATGAETGFSWADAFTTLQDALAIATPDTEIWVADGIYYPDEGTGQTDNDRTSTFQLVSGAELYGGFAGTEAALSERDIGSGTNVTVLSGDLEQNDGSLDSNGVVTDTAGLTGDNALTVVTGDSLDASTVFDGFTITAGLANPSPPDNFAGGVLLSNGSNAALSNLTIRGNQAQYGGGLVNSGDTTFSSVGFYDNTAELAGALWAGSGNPTFTNGSFIRNTADGAGAVYVNAGEPTFDATLFESNTATVSAGGAISNQGTLTITNSNFLLNFAANAAGGAIAHSVGTMTITDTAFDTNFADTDGGALSLVVNTDTVLTNVIFFKNDAGNDGGAIHNDEANLTLTNVTLTENVAGNDGGAIFNYLSEPTIQNSIFWANEATRFGPEMANTGNAAAAVTYTLIDAAGVYNASASWTENGAGNITDGSDPLFVETRRTLQFGSPAIDAGDNAVISGTSEDYSGNPRVVDGDSDGTATVDMGAYEYQLTAPDDPTGVSVFYFAAPHEVELTWTDEAITEDGYTVERKKDAAADWYEIGTVGADVESFTDDTVTCDQDYVYRVTATNTAGDSAPVESNVVNTECNIFDDIPGPNQPPFFEPWIEDFYQAGITTGCDQGAEGVDLSYCPETTVDRGQMAVLILRALNYPNGYTPEGLDPNPFIDVPSPNQPPFFEEWIEDFYNMGFTTGCNQGAEGVDLRYCPETNVDRGQMAVLMLRALNITPTDDPNDPFIDVPSPNQPPAFEAWIETFYNEGITTGCNNGDEGVDLRFCPETTVDRGQMAVFILRAFDNIPDPDDP